MRNVLSLSMCTFLLMLSACGGKSSCEQAGELICERACACGQDKCVVATKTSGGTGTVSFKDRAGCTAMYVDLGCMGGEGKIDYDACHEALKGAQCAGSTPDGVLLPAACRAPK